MFLRKRSRRGARGVKPNAERTNRFFLTYIVVECCESGFVDCCPFVPMCCQPYHTVSDLSVRTVQPRTTGYGPAEVNRPRISYNGSRRVRLRFRVINLRVSMTRATAFYAVVPHPHIKTPHIPFQTEM